MRDTATQLSDAPIAAAITATASIATLVNAFSGSPSSAKLVRSQ